MKVLLTGASGAIGGELIPFLLQKGMNILGVSRKNLEIPEVNFKNLRLDLNKIVIKDSKIIYKEDLRIESLLNDELENINCVVHLAGLASGEGKTREDYLLSNYENTVKLIKIAQLKKISTFIYSSSASVYGFKKNTICKETDPTEGSSHYAISKIFAENAILDSEIPNKIILRVGSVFGKNLKSTINKLINFQKKGLLPVPMKKNNYKSFIYIEDLILFMEKFIHYKGSGIFNICYPEAFEYGEIIKIIMKNSNYKSMKVYIPEFSYILEEYIRKIFFNHSDSKLKPLFQSVIMDSTKLLNEFKIEPTIGMEEGIKKSMN